MKLVHIPVTAQISEEELRALPAGKLEKLRNDAWNLAEAYEAASIRSKQGPTAIAYKLDEMQAKGIAMKIEAEAKRRKEIESGG